MNDDISKYGKNPSKIKKNVKKEILLASRQENPYLKVANDSTPFLRFYRHASDVTPVFRSASIERSTRLIIVSKSFINP
jgi:hypothetical protein